VRKQWKQKLKYHIWKSCRQNENKDRSFPTNDVSRGNSEKGTENLTQNEQPVNERNLTSIVKTKKT
jgi:hypothetical protein